MCKSNEYKHKAGGPELGDPRTEVIYYSPKDGVQILPEDENPRQIIRLVEKAVGISSFVDGI